MRSKIIVTEDNSKTLLIPELNESYHSTKGAITEAKHVFIKEGLLYRPLKSVNIFEMGLGTGLNAIITLHEAINRNLSVNYTCVEPYPLGLDKLNEVDYLTDLNYTEYSEAYKKMHTCKDHTPTELFPNFTFTKFLSKIQDTKLPNDYFDLIYFDAFGPKVQPELWSASVLDKMKQAMRKDAILVTYCAQGAFKRTLKELGFEVQSIPGPPGKREMTRAINK
ncbi:MAG: tRNA (5-methylaminomethyl-2-thiouridine)(34)-methyltransferase MnmD [Crocinitomicaceae bacterium]|nr:tRNA (5-methylaminomethyl-2-thiouridine)(34)-methyltransferase MnmD [Crocinitomicaceae bacterium]